MKTTRILILEDDLKTLSVIMGGLFELEKELVGKIDFAVTVFSEYSEAEGYLNKIENPSFDIVLLDRDCKLCGSFHVLDFDKFGKDKIISISSTPQWNEEAKAAGITRIVAKDFSNLEDFKKRLIEEIKTVESVKKHVKSVPLELETFTKDAQQALVVARERAHEAGIDYVGTEHVLMGILSQHHSSGSNILMSFGVSLDNVFLVLKTVGREKQTAKPAKKGDGGLSGVAKQAVEDAIRCAHDFGHKTVGTTHLLFALCSQHETAFTVILENMKILPQTIKETVVNILKRNSETDTADKKKKWIEGYGNLL